MLVELSVMEQRYQAVLAVVQDGWKVTEVVERLGVSRQSVHAWIVRYEQGGLASLADRSHCPWSCPHQTAPQIGTQICELRRQHPGWGRCSGEPYLFWRIAFIVASFAVLVLERVAERDVHPVDQRAKRSSPATQAALRGNRADPASASRVAALVIVVVTTAPPPSGGAETLEYVDANRSIYTVRQALWLAPSGAARPALTLVRSDLRIGPSRAQLDDVCGRDTKSKYDGGDRASAGGGPQSRPAPA